MSIIIGYRRKLHNKFEFKLSIVYIVVYIACAKFYGTGHCYVILIKLKLICFCVSVGILYWLSVGAN